MRQGTAGMRCCQFVLAPPNTHGMRINTKTSLHSLPRTDPGLIRVVKVLHAGERAQLAVVADAARLHAAPQAVHVHKLANHRDRPLEPAEGPRNTSVTLEGHQAAVACFTLLRSLHRRGAAHLPVHAELQ